MGILRIKLLGKVAGLMAICSSCFQLLAQEPTGGIAGKVVDFDFGDGLRAVVIKVADSDVEIYSDIEGRYQIRDLSAGTYSLVFEKSGYQTSTVTDIEVEAGEVFSLDVPLISTGADFELAEFTITASEVISQQADLLIDRQRAPAVSDVLGSDFISRASAGDAAEAMTKMTGVNVVDGKYAVVRGLGDRYSNTMMNGAVLPSNDPNKKTVQLDIIPSDLLEKIVTHKSFTPDRPGDFTGGSTELTTKSFPEEFVFNLSLSVGYNSNATGEDIWGIPGRDMDFFGNTDEGLPSVVPSLPVDWDQSNQSEKLEYYDALHASGFFPVRKKADPDMAFGISVGDSKPLFSEGKFGYFVSFTHDHNFSYDQEGRLERWIGSPDDPDSLSGFDMETSDEEISWGSLVNLALALDSNNEISYVFVNNQKSNDTVELGDNGFDKGTTISEAGQGIDRGLPEGHDSAEEYLTIATLKHSEKSLGAHWLKGKHVLPFLNDTKFNWVLNHSETSEDIPDERGYTFIRWQFEDGNSALVPFTENPRYPSRAYSNLSDEKDNYTADFTIPIKSGLFAKSEFKTGLFYSDASRTSLSRYFSYQWDGSLTSGYGTEQADRRISFIEELEDNKFFDGDVNGYGPGEAEYIDQSRRSGNARSYNGSEEITAYFLMGDVELKNGLRFIFGARHEDTDMYVASIPEMVNAFLAKEGTITDSTWLPAFHAIKPLGSNGNMNLRFSFGRTLARPTFREFSPFRSESIATGEKFEGNPDLNITVTDNFDLRWEWFFNEGDVFAAGVYYKDFSDPIVSTVKAGASSRPLYSWDNAPGGVIKGFEMEVRKSLGYDWSVGGNLTFIESELDPLTSSSSDSGTVFEGQPSFIFNANIGYDSDVNGWAANLFYNYVDETLRLIGDRVPNVMEAARHTVDFNVSKEFGKFKVKLSVKNILDEERLEYYDGLGEPIYNLSHSGRSISLSGSYRY